MRIVPATLAHAEALAPVLRPEDAAECLAWSGEEPLAALKSCLAMSTRAWALVAGDEVLYLAGVGPAASWGPNVGIVWGLSGRSVERHGRAFLRACKPMVAAMLEVFPVLINAADSRYSKALRWLEWLGATLSPTPVVGADGVPFVPFCLRRA